MARKTMGDQALDDLVQMPWWVSATASAALFVVPRIVVFLVPSWSLLALAMPALTIFALILFAVAVLSFFRSWGQDRQLDGQLSIETIRELSWKQFEELLAAAYRRQGYTVKENLGGGADGGIDLWLRRDRELVLVQCKHWKKYTVDVRVVREMFGLMHMKGAHRIIIVSSGRFTPEAIHEAMGKPIELVDEPKLLQLIREVQSESRIEARLEAAESLCPKCGQALVLRVARKGVHAGSAFLGCSDYPRCRYIQ